MIFLLSLALALIFVSLFSKQLRARPLPFYILAAGISVSVVICTWHHTVFPKDFEVWIWPIFARGAFAGALFVIIMATGVFPNGSKPIRLLMPIRAHLSILASILTLGHNIAYGRTYFTALFFAPTRLSTPTLLAAVCSLIMILIMLPLFITSFKFVRKHMKARTWKRLQRLAYVFYGLLYCHIMLLTIPNAIQGRSGYMVTVFVYSLVFISYLFCRVMKAVSIHEKTTASLSRKQAVGLLCGVVMSGLILIAVISAHKTVIA